MFKIDRPSRHAAGFADTQLLHADDDGFAPTEMFEDAAVATVAAAPARAPAAVHARPAAARAIDATPAQAESPAMPPSWVTSQWVAAQEAKAHEAADQARAVIAAQRRADVADAGAPMAPRTAGDQLRAALWRLLPLFVAVAAAVASISVVLPLIDRP